MLRQPVYHVNTFHRIATDSGFGCEGQSISAIHDGCHRIVYLGSCRVFVFDHCFQQIGCHKNSGCFLMGFVQDDLLEKGYFNNGNLFAQITTVDQNIIGLVDNVVKVFKGVSAFYF